MTGDDDHGASAIDPAKLRRFAIGVAAIMLVFVAAGGSQVANYVTIEALKIELSKPGVLIWLVPVVSVYATIRYWWYGIQVPVTRQKIRKYLQHKGSLLIIKNYKETYVEALKRQRSGSVYLRPHQELETKVPPGLTPFPFIVFTDAVDKPDHDYMLHLCRNRIDTYFPAITVLEFSVDDNQDHHAWVSPSNLRFNTQARAFMESCDLWLPIYLNGLGVLVYLLYLYYSAT